MSWEFLERLPGNSEIIFTRVLTSEVILPSSDFVATKPDEITSFIREDVDIFNEYILWQSDRRKFTGLV